MFNRYILWANSADDIFFLFSEKTGKIWEKKFTIASAENLLRVLSVRSFKFQIRITEVFSENTHERDNFTS